MRVTIKQSHVLANLHRIVVCYTPRGKMVPYLDGKECRLQLNALAVKGLVRLNYYGRPTKTGEPSGIIRSRRPKAESHNPLISLIGESAT